jgi:hypothetical protein
VYWPPPTDRPLLAVVVVSISSGISVDEHATLTDDGEPAARMFEGERQ